MRSFRISFSSAALLAALGGLSSALSIADSASSIEDSFAQAPDIQNTTIAQNDTAATASQMPDLTLDESSNITVKYLSTTLSPDYSNDTAIELNATNRIIRFSRNGFTFIGRTFDGTRIGPDRTSVAKFLDHVVQQGIDQLPGVISDEVGPFYDVDSKASLALSGTWARAQLKQALTTLRQDFRTQDTIEHVQISIADEHQNRCTLKVTNAQILSVSMAYDRGKTTPNSNQARIRAFLDETLVVSEAEQLLDDLDSWIRTKYPRAYLDPKLRNTWTAGEFAELDIIVPNEGRYTADITWADFATGYTAVRHAISKKLGPTRRVALLASFEDANSLRQVGFCLRGSPFIFLGPSPVTSS